MSSKYSKVLTIILIVVILIIVGLLVFWGVDTLTKYDVKSDQEHAIEAFKNQNKISSTTNSITNTNNTNTNTQISNEEFINPYANLVVPDENTNPNISPEENGEFIYNGLPMLGYISFPKFKDLKEIPIYKEASNTALEKGVGVLVGELNKPGITVIAGHNYRNGTFFSNNAKLSEGDKIYITDNSKNKVVYSIYKKYQTTPEDGGYTTTDTEGKREIVLTTCTDDSKGRIIICAREVAN